MNRADFDSLRNQLPSTPTAQPCACIGPQRGEPRCPCAMREVVIKDGRYVVPEQDLGPVAKEST